MITNFKLFESPDKININNNIITWNDNPSNIGFGYYDGKFYICSETHGKKLGISCGRELSEYPGRLFTKYNVITFWKYPDPKKFKEIIKNLENKLDIKLDMDELKVEIVIDKNDKIIPKSDNDLMILWNGTVDSHVFGIGDKDTKMIYIKASEYKDYYEGIYKTSPTYGELHYVSPLEKDKLAKALGIQKPKFTKKVKGYYPFHENKLNEYMVFSEESSFDNIKKILRDNCSNFLKELKETESRKLLFRGLTANPASDILVNAIRNDRTPKDITKSIHNELDDKFYKIFNWRARSNGVFVTPDSKVARSYIKNSSINNYPYIFFPIGDYKYVYNEKVSDLFMTVDENPLCYDLNIDNINWLYNTIIEVDCSYEEFKEYYEENWFKEREIFLNDLINEYRDYMLNLAIDRNVEITFNCEKYFLIHFKFFNNLIDFIYR
jgi:hypothetical protein